MAVRMADKLLDEDGKLKPFRQWKDEVKGISDHYNGVWLRTEYNTAVIRAHNAADWRQFERNRDIMPNLRWMPTTSPHPEAEHRSFWEKKLTRPIDDPFWNKHRPGDRWNCKCSLEATDEDITPIPEDADKIKPQRGLENNPGKDGQLFSKKHPYFPKNCKECTFNKNKGTITNIVDAFLNRANDCYNCRFIDGCTERATEKQHIDSAAMDRKREAKEQNLMPKLDRQPCEYVQKGALNRTMKVRNKLFTHCHHDYDVNAAIFIWNNPQKLRFVRSCELGEGKDMSIPKNQENIRKKREEYHFVYFNQYEFQYNKRTFIVKTAVCEEDYEQFYSLYEK